MQRLYSVMNMRPRFDGSVVWGEPYLIDFGTALPASGMPDIRVNCWPNCFHQPASDTSPYTPVLKNEMPISTEMDMHTFVSFTKDAFFVLRPLQLLRSFEFLRASARLDIHRKVCDGPGVKNLIEKVNNFTLKTFLFYEYNTNKHKLRKYHHCS